VPEIRFEHTRQVAAPFLRGTRVCLRAGLFATANGPVRLTIEWAADHPNMESCETSHTRHSSLKIGACDKDAAHYQGAQGRVSEDPWGCWNKRAASGPGVRQRGRRRPPGQRRDPALPIPRTMLAYGGTPYVRTDLIFVRAPDLSQKLGEETSPLLASMWNGETNDSY